VYTQYVFGEICHLIFDRKTTAYTFTGTLSNNLVKGYLIIEHLKKCLLRNREEEEEIYQEGPGEHGTKYS